MDEIQCHHLDIDRLHCTTFLTIHYISARIESNRIESQRISTMTTTTEKKMLYLDMVIAAIPAIKDRKGASRAAISSWIQKTYNKEGGGVFNGSLRTALNKGVEKGMLVPGATDQRYKIGVLPKVVKKKPASKKKSSSKKKKSSKKKWKIYKKNSEKNKKKLMGKEKNCNR